MLVLIVLDDDVLFNSTDLIHPIKHTHVHTVLFSCA